MIDTSRRARLYTALSLAPVLAAGVILMFNRGPLHGPINVVLAEMLYVICWCLTLFFVWPQRRFIARIVIGVFVGTCALEFLQLWHPPFLEAIRSNLLGRNLIGRIFDRADFINYVLGGVAAWLWLRAIAQAAGRGPHVMGDG